MDMNQDVHIITVIVRHSQSGLFTATSDDLDGVYMAHTDCDAIVADLPAVVARWFKNNRNIDVEVFTQKPVKSDGEYFIPTIPVPVEVAARSLGR
jgi:hypothetical protein